MEITNLSKDEIKKRLAKEEIAMTVVGHDRIRLPTAYAFARSHARNETPARTSSTLLLYVKRRRSDDS